MGYRGPSANLRPCSMGQLRKLNAIEEKIQDDRLKIDSLMASRAPLRQSSAVKPTLRVFTSYVIVVRKQGLLYLFIRLPQGYFLSSQLAFNFSNARVFS
ncbi:hypothetical protein ElyMa_006045800 [Elysia marginata]|uniref:Uncharacterized protein n=1 Tax=Elysia marginata TaxID=1093978 RepID=A0AAV4GKZ9_9GAST|nr:hypothetical protein ElyMa_006045800 [Elysia marginata]